MFCVILIRLLSTMSIFGLRDVVSAVVECAHKVDADEDSDQCWLPVANSILRSKGHLVNMGLHES